MITKIKASNYRIFRDLEFFAQPDINILVGNNEAGKSTVLEIIELTISGRVRGRWAADDLSPYWFNHKTVEVFFNTINANSELDSLPTIELEVFFCPESKEWGRFQGLHNSLHEDCPGFRMRVLPDPNREDELKEYLAQEEIPRLIPTDLYYIDWRDFAGNTVSRQAPGLGVVSLNSDTIHASRGIDYKLRQLIRDFVTPQESVDIALNHRKSKASVSKDVLSKVNERIIKDGTSFGVTLQMDQSANSNWDVSVVPHLGKTPFQLLGKGRQVITKMALAMNQRVKNTKFVLVEEPENHLSYNEMHKTIDGLRELSNGRQMFVSTHSSFVLNRLGFRNLYLMHNARIATFDSDNITDETVRYFQKISGYDTLRLVIANKVVMVEGPSDEMIFDLAYRQIAGKPPQANGIDVLTLGTSGRRALEIANALDKTIAVIRDNDNKDPGHWEAKVSDLLKKGKREMFIGERRLGRSLEDQMISANTKLGTLRAALGITEDEDLFTYMTGNKTEWAWKLLSSNADVEFPEYIVNAIKFINAS